MSNTILTPVEVTREALVILHTMTRFMQGINKEYSKDFAIAGAKIGSTINVRLPNRFYVSDGAALDAQTTTESSVPLTLSHQWHTDMAFTTNELTLSLDDFSKRIIKPAVRKLATYIDYTGLNQVKNLYNCVGTMGNSPGYDNSGSALANSKSPQIFLNAGAVLDMMGAPDDDERQIILTPLANSYSVAGLSGLFNDQKTIGEQYKRGVMVPSLGFRFHRDQNVNTITTGTHAITSSYPLVYLAGQSGSSLNSYGWTDGVVLKAGETIQLVGVNSVGPENQQDTGQLANFVLTADATSVGGAATLSISPAIILAASTVSNGTVTALPAADAHITMFGSASTTYPLMVAYHKDAFTLGSADLEMPEGVHFAGRENFEGISLRIVRQYLINSDQIPCRVDVLGGFATLRAELGVKIYG